MQATLDHVEASDPARELPAPGRSCAPGRETGKACRGVTADSQARESVVPA